MSRLQKMSESDHTPLIRVLFGHSSPAPAAHGREDLKAGIPPLDFLDPDLDTSQKDAVRFALASADVALIHGPPGVSEMTCSGVC